MWTHLESVPVGGTRPSLRSLGGCGTGTCPTRDDEKPKERGTRVGPSWYRLHGGRLRQCDADGEERSSVPVSPDPFLALQPIAEATFPDMAFAIPELIKIGIRAEYSLQWDDRRSRFIAHHPMTMAFVAALRLDGTIDWVRLLHPMCCSWLHRLGDDVMVHTSSCGSQLTVLSQDGAILRQHRLRQSPWGALPDRDRGVCLWSPDEIQGFDAYGEPRWTIELPGIEEVRVHDGRIHALTKPNKGEYQLVTFALHW